MSSLALVVPGNVHTVISGGNLYDLRLAEALTRAGNDVVLATVEGDWPAADARSEELLASTLRRLQAEDPYRSDPEARRAVIIDGLVGAACPRVVAEAAAAGMDLRMLVHLPLGLEPGLDSTTAAQRNGLERASVRAVTSVLATSAWAAKELRRRHGIEHVAVATPGVEPAALAGGSSPPRLLQVGALTAGKNQLAVVAALSKLTELDWTLRLVGSATRNPQYAAQVRQAIEEAGLGSRVLLMGEKTGDALDRAWHAADLSLLPSSVETYGMVVTESLARGVPVVICRGTGAEEALGFDQRGQRPGFSIEARSSTELHAVLNEWLRGPALRETVRAAAQSRRAMLSGWDETARTVAAALQ